MGLPIRRPGCERVPRPIFFKKNQKTGKKAQKTKSNLPGLPAVRILGKIKKAMIFSNFQALTGKLRRDVSPLSTWIREIDGLRFVAIFAVVLQHLMERFGRKTALPIDGPLLDDPFAFFVSRGTVGVFLFFAISGFVLALPFAKSTLASTARPSLRDFFLRRLTRLEPPFVIWTTVFALVLLVKGDWVWAELAPHFWASLTYSHGLIFGQHSPINPVTWSLEVEIQFYLAAPFLTILFFKISNPTLRRSVLVATIFSWILLQNQFGWLLFPYKLTILGHFQYFLVGLLAVDFYLHSWKFDQKGKLGWDLAAVGAYVAMCYLWTTELWKNAVFVVALFVLFTAAFRGIFFKKMLQNQWLAVTGGMCYTIYLVHLPMLEALTSLSKNWVVGDKIWVNFLVQAAVFLPIVWLFGAVFFLFLEKPFMQWRPQTVVHFLKNNIKWPNLPRLVFRNLMLATLVFSVPFLAKSQPSDSLRGLRLRPLETLVAAAIDRAPSLSANQLATSQQILTTEIERKNWLDMFTANGAAYYGNGSVNEARATQNADPLNYATGRLSSGINLTVGVNLSGGDLATRRQKIQVQNLQTERLLVERKIIESELRQLISDEYFALENVLKSVELRAEAIENISLARSLAEKYFKEGAIPFSEITALAAQETNARELLFNAQSEAKKRAARLQNLTGVAIWDGNF